VSIQLDIGDVLVAKDLLILYGVLERCLQSVRGNSIGNICIHPNSNKNVHSQRYL
jgi:hypothetical protein